MTPNLKLKIKELYKNLLNKNFPFDTICWALAELQLIFEKGRKKYSEKEVIERTKKIFNSGIDYDTICWFIAQFKVYLEEIHLYP